MGCNLQAHVRMRRCLVLTTGRLGNAFALHRPSWDFSIHKLVEVCGPETVLNWTLELRHALGASTAALEASAEPVAPGES